MRSFGILLSLLFLCGCGLFQPFVDARKEAGQVQTFGQSTPDKPAICYNPLWTTEKQRQSLAEAECQKQQKHAVFVEKTSFSCCFFSPDTAFYDCQK